MVCDRTAARSVRFAALAIGMVYGFVPQCGLGQTPNPSEMQAKFIYETAPFPSCHASTIEEGRDGLVAAWFGGTHEKHPDVGIWVSRHIDGQWTAPVEVADGVVPQSDRGPGIPGRYPTWNPVLFQPRHDKDAPLVLFYKVGPTPETWWGMMMESVDGGKSWSKPVRLPDGILGAIKNKPVELADGTWLCPSSTESEEEESKWQVQFEWTTDRGRSWQRTPSLNDGVAIQAIQPSLLHLGGDRWRAIGRSRQDRIFEMDSSDGGRTWSEMRLGSLPNNNSGIDAVTLKSGMHVIVYNHVAGTPGEWGGKRTPLNVAVSKDGTTWQPWAVLESEPGEFSYPAIIQSSDGLIHITYTWNRKRIKHVVLDPASLRVRS